MADEAELKGLNVHKIIEDNPRTDSFFERGLETGTGSTWVYTLLCVVDVSGSCEKTGETIYSDFHLLPCNTSHVDRVGVGYS